VYESSEAQRRQWMFDSMSGKSFAHHLHAVNWLENVNLEVLEKAYQAVVLRHESLRTYFEIIDGQLFQKISDYSDLNFSVEIQKINSDISGSALEKLVQEEVSKTFDLFQGPLIRFKILKSNAAKFLMVFTIHHIIADEWSMSVFMNDLKIFYDNLMSGKSQRKIPTLAIQYKDYSAWHNRLMEDNKNLSTFWMNQFYDPVKPLRLPKGNFLQSDRGGSLKFKLTEQLTEDIRNFCVRENASIFMLILSVYNMVLYRMTRQPDIILGFPVNGRDHVQLENQIGYYVNTIAIRSTFGVEQTFADYFSKTIQTVLAAIEHQAYPIARLTNDLRQAGILAPHLTLFETGMSWQNLENNTLWNETDKWSEAVESYEVSDENAMNDLWLYGFEDGKQISFDLQFNQRYFTRDSIIRLQDDLIKLLSVIVVEKDIRIYDAIQSLSGSDESERRNRQKQQLINRMEEKY
jgi:hypothetical protein